LRARSTAALLEIGYPGYAVGGLAVGESKAQMNATLDFAAPMLPADKPRYLMGVGAPDDLANAVLRGIDLFDCVLPTRIARHSAVFTPEGTVNVGNASFARDERPIQQDCDCACCTGFSRAYLRHLVKAKELLGHTLLSLHNIRFLIRHMHAMRRAILEGDLAAYVSDFLTRYTGVEQ
jgi:queuine tRNA-ribosyltransferase